MAAQKREKKPSTNIQFLSTGTTLLDKHRLTAEVVNTKPAGCNSGELEALWQSDFSLPCSLLFLLSTGSATYISKSHKI